MRSCKRETVIMMSRKDLVRKACSQRLRHYAAVLGGAFSYQRLKYEQGRDGPEAKEDLLQTICFHIMCYDF